ncbi:MAG: efflux RND transporter permease subunit [Nitrospirota bacterium]
MSIAEFSIKNPVFVNLLFFIIIIGGIFSYSIMPQEVFPVIPLDKIVISTTYFGVSPEEIEKLITIPIENRLKNIEGIEKINSVSQEGISVIEMDLEKEVSDVQKVVEDIRNDIDKLDIPEDADDSEVIIIDTRHPVINLSISGDVSEDILREIADEMEERILQITGVRNVVISGYRDREIWIEVDADRLNSYQISIDEVVRALQNRNINVPGGIIKGKKTEAIIRTTGEYKNRDEIKNTIVRFNENGRHIYIHDLAYVRPTFKEDISYGRINGKRAISLIVNKKSTGNTITIANRIKEIAKEKELLEGIRLTISNDSSIWIKNRLQTVYNSGSIGLILVIFILFLFLNWRMAFWTAMGIPASFLGTILVMHFFGMTINMISLFAMIVVLGMVVDDAIIVTENVYRYQLNGYSFSQAAIEGSKEVLMPVIAAVTTSIAAFIPMLLMKGIMGKFISVIPKVVSIALFISLIEALFVLPSHLADFSKLPRGKAKRDIEGAWFHTLRKRYRKILVSLIRYRYITSLCIVLVAIGTIFFALNYMKFVLFGMKDLPGAVVKIETYKGTRIEETSRILKQVEEIALRIPENDLDTVTSLIGSHFDFSTGRNEIGSNLAQAFFEFTEFNTPSRRNGYEIRDDIRKMVKRIKGAKSIEVVGKAGGPPVGPAVELQIRGKEFKKLKIITGELEEYLKGIDGIYNVKDDFSHGKNEIKIAIDEKKASLFDLDMATIARTIKTSFAGTKATEIRRGREEIDVIVKFKDDIRNNIDYLKKIMIVNKRGQNIPFSTVADISHSSGINSIVRRNRKRSITLTADVDTDIITSTVANRMIAGRFKEIEKRFPGYDMVFAGEAEEQRESMQSLMQAFIISLLIIYLILGTLFKSFLQPFIVMAAIPFAFIGVIAGHYIMNQDLGLLSLIGLTALVGIVVNDSLVFADFINRSRSKGGSRWRSIILSGKVRFRPIILTSITTIFGLAPLAFKTQGQAAFLAPMAISIVWGLIFSTILILIIFPCFFAIADDLIYLTERILRRDRS